MTVYIQTGWIEAVCAFCSSPLPVNHSAGRPALYCCNACKMRAYRFSKKSPTLNKTVTKSAALNKTVTKSAAVQPVLIAPPSVFIRSFDDIKSFFGG